MISASAVIDSSTGQTVGLSWFQSCKHWALAAVGLGHYTVVVAIVAARACSVYDSLPVATCYLKHFKLQGLVSHAHRKRATEVHTDSVSVNSVLSA